MQLQPHQTLPICSQMGVLVHAGIMRSCDEGQAQTAAVSGRQAGGLSLLHHQGHLFTTRSSGLLQTRCRCECVLLVSQSLWRSRANLIHPSIYLFYTHFHLHSGLWGCHRANAGLQTKIIMKPDFFFLPGLNTSTSLPGWRSQTAPQARGGPQWWRPSAG